MYFTGQKNIQRGLKELDYDGLKIQKLNIRMNRVQRVDMENGIICLIMFTVGVLTIEMSKIAHFLCFLLITAFFADSVVSLIFHPQRDRYNSKAHLS